MLTINKLKESSFYFIVAAKKIHTYEGEKIILIDIFGKNYLSNKLEKFIKLQNYEEYINVILLRDIIFIKTSEYKSFFNYDTDKKVKYFEFTVQSNGFDKRFSSTETFPDLTGKDYDRYLYIKDLKYMSFNHPYEIK